MKQLIINPFIWYSLAIITAIIVTGTAWPLLAFLLFDFTVEWEKEEKDGK